MYCSLEIEFNYSPVSKVLKQWPEVDVFVRIKKCRTAVARSFIWLRFVNFLQIVHYILHFAFRHQFYEFVVCYYTWKIKEKGKKKKKHTQLNTGIAPY